MSSSQKEKKDVSRRFFKAFVKWLDGRQIRQEHKARFGGSWGYANNPQVAVCDVLFVMFDPSTVTEEDPRWHEPMETILQFELNLETDELRLVFEHPIFQTLLENDPASPDIVSDRVDGKS